MSRKSCSIEERAFSSLAKFSAVDFVNRRIDFRESSQSLDSQTSSSPISSEPLRTDPSSTDSISSSQLQWKEIRPVGSGLFNLGNTCFLNSVLQCLFYTAPFANFLLSQEHSNRCRSKNSFCSACEMEKTISGCFLNGKRDNPCSPKSLAYNVKCIGKQFRLGRQEDAHEFLRFLIESIQKSSSSSSASKGLISKVFGGLYESSVTCTSCKYVSKVSESWLDVSLEIKNCDSLQKALKHFTTPERLSSANLYKCNSCHTYVEAYKRMMFDKLSPILTIHLKRFTATHKIGKFVSFPLQLDMTAFCTLNSTSSVGSIYELYAVLVHDGFSCNSGHYYSYVKGSNGIWYCMNDSLVRQVGVETVLRQNAYILFYSLKMTDRVKAVKINKQSKEEAKSNTAEKQKNSECSNVEMLKMEKSAVEKAVDDVSRNHQINEPFESSSKRKREKQEKSADSNPELDSKVQLPYVGTSFWLVEPIV